MKQKILVFGATGSVGSQVVKELTGKGFAVRACTRTPEKHNSTEQVEYVRFDYDKNDNLGQLMEGVTGVYVMTFPLDSMSKEHLSPIVEAAKKAQVEHLVLMTAMGVDQNEQSPLNAVEKQVKNSGLNYTILRPNFFMENFYPGFLHPMIENQGQIILAAGDGKTSFISVEDIAKTGATVMANNTFYGREYTLTGPEALDHNQVARVINENADRNISYTSISDEAQRAGLQQAGMKKGEIDYMSMLYGAVRSGYTAPVSNAVKEVTGSDPMSFETYTKKYSDKF